MIEILKQIERVDILGILSNLDNFKSVDVDYHPPRVERIWTQIREHRLSFHYLHPCAEGEALYHPHPWKSAIHQLDGEYETGITYSENLDFHLDNNTGKHNQSLKQIEGIKIIVKGGMYCEMLNKNAFHYVRPITLCRSVMLMGEQFETIKNPATKNLEPLTGQRMNEIRLWFYDYYANL